MKKYIFFLLILFIYCGISHAQDTEKWHIAKSTHFIVYYKNAKENFIERLINKSEEYYNEIADNLGFRRYNFWLWDNRAKIYLYDDAQDYQESSGQPLWSSGYAVVSEKTIKTFPEAVGFFETVLPHEMGHIIFREFVGFDNYSVPLWLDEGVASYQENLKHRLANRVVKDAIENGNFIGLAELAKLNPQLLTDKEAVNLFYAEAVTIVSYLVKEFGTDNFVLFCQALRDKKNLEKALSYTYPFGDIQGLDRAWQKYLKR
ncbi:MAG: hypothetical protein HZA27_03525 [Candidatus Omnitrophica bacterium]|nr:hypothetical protein [Candidatus Omnitrophota bacterium]